MKMILSEILIYGDRLRIMLQKKDLACKFTYTNKYINILCLLISSSDKSSSERGYQGTRLKGSDLPEIQPRFPTQS